MSVPGKTTMGVDGGISSEGIYNSVGRVPTIVNVIGVALEVMHPKYLGIIEWKQLVMVDELMTLYMMILADALSTMHNSKIGETSCSQIGTPYPNLRVKSSLFGIVRTISSPIAVKIRRELSDTNVMMMTTKDFDMFLLFSSTNLLPFVNCAFAKRLMLVATMILWA